MHNTKRKALLATVLGLAAAAAAIPMVVSGTASAQEGSRLCGRYWVSEDRGGVQGTGTGEVVTVLYEVPKTDLVACNGGNQFGDGEFPEGFPGTLKEQGRSVREWSTNNFSMKVCEGWKARETRAGGLGNKEIKFIGDRFPAKKDQNDICNNMNRNDNAIFTDGVYWLYDDNVEPPAGTQDTIDFHRARA